MEVAVLTPWVYNEISSTPVTDSTADEGIRFATKGSPVEKSNG